MKRILVIGAHFDDSELGVGGSMKKWSSEGKEVFKLTLTDNVTFFEQYGGISVEYERTRRESAEASSILGVKEVTGFRPVPCNDLKYDKDIMQAVEAIIYQLKIDTVVIHSPEDANRDHIEASKICFTAARHCPNVLFFKSNGYLSENGFVPNYFVDITDYVEDKRRALHCYSRENDRFGRLFDSCIEQNHFFGYSVGCAYAEQFKAIRLVEGGGE